MALEDYISKEELNNYIDGEYDPNINILSSNLSGVEGIPYQFMESVDRRIPNTTVGRKFAEKIHARLPLLFLTPCRQIFMDDFSDEDKQTVMNFLLDNTIRATDELIEGHGRYYSVTFAYDEYYNYVNCMLSSVITFLGLRDEYFTVNGSRKKLGNISWQNELNEDFKTFFSAKENVIFYLDSMDSVSESFSNNTSESALASQINGFTDTANEIQFLIGNGGLSNVLDGVESVASSITSALSGVASNIGGGVVGSLAENGINTVVNGGKIIFPKIWSDSQFSRSYSINIKLRSPDNDSLSILMNIIKPYCKLLALTMPQLMDSNSNAYKSPFLVKAYSKGLFNIDMGMITSLEVTKGAQCAWNDDGLPTQLDISLTVEDLYAGLAMSDFNDTTKQVVNNTSYMDYLANMAGLNIAQMEVGRRCTMYYYLTTSKIMQTPSRLFTKFDQSISNAIGSLYNIL